MKPSLFTALFCISLGLAGTDSYGAEPYFELRLRGDVNLDGEITSHDAFRLENFLQGNAPPPPFPPAADADADGKLDQDDVACILNWAFGVLDHPGMSPEGVVVHAPPPDLLDEVASVVESVPADIWDGGDTFEFSYDATDRFDVALLLYIPTNMFDGANAADVKVGFYNNVPAEPNGRMVRFQAVDQTGEVVATGWVCIAALDGLSASITCSSIVYSDNIVGFADLDRFFAGLGWVVDSGGGSGSLICDSNNHRIVVAVRFEP